MKQSLLTGALALGLLIPLGAAAQQTTTPNGVSRIGATNESSAPLDFSSVGVAVIDTGIDLQNPDLNVVGGVDCSVGAERYRAQNVTISGGQRSVWEEVPETPAPSTAPYTPGEASAMAAAATPATPVEEQISFAETTFKITSQTNPRDLIGNRASVKGFDDGNGHGTHVAGIIAAKDDGMGVVGVAPGASLYSVRVLDSNGGGAFENVICGLDWVAANADIIDVANMSLGGDTGRIVMDTVEECLSGPQQSNPPYVKRSELMKDELHEAVCDVVDAGVVLVVAAGNGWGDAGTVIPAGYPEVITVSNFSDFDGQSEGLSVDDPATVAVEGGNALCPTMGGRDDTFFTHLNGTPGLGIGSYGGEVVDLAAPGVCIFSTLPGGFANLTGTSMASPHVAGAAARLFVEDEDVAELAGRTSKDRDLVDLVRETLLANAERQTDAFRDSDQWHEPIVRVP